MNKFLLPYYWKYFGWILSLLGIIIAIFYIWFDFKFSMPVFAIYSSFLESKTFATFTTNFADELILILMLGGLFFNVFSKEKNELPYLDNIRNNAMARAVISNFVFLVLSFFLIFGTGFIAVLIINMFSPFLFYLGYFSYLKFRNKKSGIL